MKKPPGARWFFVRKLFLDLVEPEAVLKHEFFDFFWRFIPERREKLEHVLRVAGLVDLPSHWIRREKWGIRFYEYAVEWHRSCSGLDIGCILVGEDSAETEIDIGGVFHEFACKFRIFAETVDDGVLDLKTLDGIDGFTARIPGVDNERKLVILGNSGHSFEPVVLFVQLGSSFGWVFAQVVLVESCLPDGHDVLFVPLYKGTEPGFLLLPKRRTVRVRIRMHESLAFVHFLASSSVFGGFGILGIYRVVSDAGIPVRIFLGEIDGGNGARYVASDLYCVSDVCRKHIGLHLVDANGELFKVTVGMGIKNHAGFYYLDIVYGIPFLYEAQLPCDSKTDRKYPKSSKS